MFFYIGTFTPILPKRHDKLFLDDGWTVINENNSIVWVKGYSTECSLIESLYQIVNGYNPRGIWTVIIFHKNEYKVYHSYLRGYPLYFNGTEITNLTGLDGFMYQPNTPSLTLENSQLSMDDAATLVTDILVENILGFKKYNNLDLTVLFSGGLDTTTVWCLIDSLNISYDFDAHISAAHITTKGLRYELGVIREYETPLTSHVSNKIWAYDISSLRKDINWYSTGFYAETITLRSMVAFGIIAGHYNKTVYDFVKESDYVYNFLQRKKDIFNRVFEAPTDIVSVKTKLVHIIFDDYQMWHLDNNFHFSPFYDLRISEIVYRLSIEDMIDNCRNGTLQRKIIQKINPFFLTLVSPKKNSGNVMINFFKNYGKIKFPANTKKYIR